MSGSSDSFGSTRRIIAWGIAWGCIVSIVEALAFSNLLSWQFGELLLWALAAWVTPIWCVTGCLFAWVAARAERRGRWRDLVIGWLLVAIISAVLQPLVSAVIYEATRSTMPSLEAVRLASGISPATSARNLSLAMYDLWVNLFYGALLVAAFALTARAERSRAMLHAVAVARSRTEARLDNMQLHLLENQVDPRLLLDTMSELDRYYRSDPPRADRLLEALVEFLRCVIPGLQKSTSTLEAELRLARAYSDLQQERGAGCAWDIQGTFIAAPSVRFPSLLMLPLLALGADGQRPQLRVRESAGAMTLTLGGLGRGRTRPLARQLRQRLTTLYGGAFIVEVDPAADTQLAITLGVSNEKEKHHE